MTTAKGGRPATGTLKWRRDPKQPGKPAHWHVRISLVNGERPWVALDPTIPREDEARARAGAREVSDEARASGAVPASVKETVAEYAGRWCTWREGRGFGCVSEDRTLLRRHVLPTIGALDARTVGRDDLKRLVSELDAKVVRGETFDADGGRRPFGWKTACNAWTVVRALFRDARRAKDVAMCIREDNPAEGVAGPDMGARKAKVYLWPSEFQALITCERVPLRWRRLFALAVYTYARAGELAALDWSDIDLAHRTIHIHRSLDSRRSGALKSTKSDTARRIPIEPALAPLLDALRAAGTVVRLPGDGASAKLRMYLRRAGVTRADLFASDATRKAITFHDLRATGITWCAVRGDDPLKIMQRAGHTDFETTKIYLREAENLSAGFGTVFPELPAELLGSASVLRSASIGAPFHLETSTFVWPLRGSNPRETLVKTETSDLSADETSPPSRALVGSSSALDSSAPEPSSVEEAIAKALGEAATAGRFDVVAELARELQARREARASSNVLPFPRKGRAG